MKEDFSTVARSLQAGGGGHEGGWHGSQWQLAVEDVESPSAGFGGGQEGHCGQTGADGQAGAGGHSGFGVSVQTGH